MWSVNRHAALITWGTPALSSVVHEAPSGWEGLTACAGLGWFWNLADNRHSMSQSMGLSLWNTKCTECISTWQGMFHHLPELNPCEMVQQCRTPQRAAGLSSPPEEEEHSLFLGDGSS